MSARPHVVLLVLDTVRADLAGLGSGSDGVMPALAQFAKQATVYPTTWSASPWTLPSHASLFTGAYVSRHGCDEHRRTLDGRLPTLAESLRDAGYATGAVSANAWVGPDFGLDRGFDRFVRGWQLLDSREDLAGVRRRGRETGRSDLREALTRVARGGFAPAAVNTLHYLLARRRGRFGGARLARRAGRLARQLRASGQPVLLFVNLLDAHARYWPSRRYRRRFLGDQARRAGSVNQDPWAFVGGQVRMGEDDFALLRGLYCGELAALDDVLAGFFADLDAVLGLDDTVVVVTSDHGEHLGEHGLMDHQYSLSEVLLRVPLLVRRPAAEGAGIQLGLRQTVDIAPTLLRTAGVQVSARPGFGRPLEAGPREWALAEYAGPQPTMAALERRGLAHSFRVFDRSLRALRLADGRKIVVGSDSSLELYDVAADPDERIDLAPDRPAEADEMVRQLEGIVGEWSPNATRVPAGDRDNDAKDVDADVKRTLESLGYLQ